MKYKLRGEKVELHGVGRTDSDSANSWMNKPEKSATRRFFTKINDILCFDIDQLNGPRTSGENKFRVTGAPELCLGPGEAQTLELLPSNRVTVEIQLTYSPTGFASLEGDYL